MDYSELIKAIKAGECPKLLPNSSLMLSYKSEPVEVREGSMTTGDGSFELYRFGVGSYFVMSSDFFVCTALEGVKSGEFLIKFIKVCSTLKLILELVRRLEHSMKREQQAW
jgi:hypothetical protein